MRKYVGFGGGFSFDPSGEARASGMRGYSKVYGKVEAGPVSIEGELQGTYDFTPGRLKRPLQGSCTGILGSLCLACNRDHGWAQPVQRRLRC